MMIFPKNLVLKTVVEDYQTALLVANMLLGDAEDSPILTASEAKLPDDPSIPGSRVRLETLTRQKPKNCGLVP